jgi:hypothetical protein
METLSTQGRAEIVKYVTDGGKLLAVGDGVATACGGEGVWDSTKAVARERVRMQK